jgi:uracil-DNA glycosylase
LERWKEGGERRRRWRREMATAEKRFELLQEHKRKWAEKWDDYCKKHSTATNALYYMRYAYRGDPLMWRSRAYMLGCGRIDSPRILFVAKCPRSKDDSIARPFSDSNWDVIRLWANMHARGKFYFSYLFPSKIYQTYRYNESTKKKETITRLTDECVEVYGWYMRALISLLKPRIIVPLGSFASRAVLGAFTLTGMRKYPVGEMRNVYCQEVRVEIPHAHDESLSRIYRVIAFPDPYQSMCVQRKKPRDLMPASKHGRSQKKQMRGNDMDCLWRQGLVGLGELLNRDDELEHETRRGDATGTLMETKGRGSEKRRMPPQMCSNDQHRRKTHQGLFKRARKGPLTDYYVESDTEEE